MIYKYRSFYSSYKFDPFLKSQLYFASPSEFNDPFESRPYLTGMDSLEERKSVVDSYIKRELSNLGFKKREAIRSQIMKRLLNQDLVRKDLYELLSNYGIFCASKTWSQCLMWSHYSDSHKGFCIGFEFEGEFDKEVGMAHEVVYADEYPKLNPMIFSDKSEESNLELLTTTLGTKSTDWKYEEEIRYIKLAREGGHGVYKFSQEKIHEVIIGACAEDENKAELIQLVKSRMPWVNVYQSSLSDSKYELNREKIS